MEDRAKCCAEQKRTYHERLYSLGNLPPLSQRNAEFVWVKLIPILAVYKFPFVLC